MKTFCAFLAALLLRGCVSCPAADTVRLLWDRSLDLATGEPATNVTGYIVGLGGAPRDYTVTTNVGDVTEARVPVLAGARTFYAVLAHDADGLQSGWSDEVVFTPGGPAQLLISGMQAVTLTNSVPVIEPPAFAARPGFQFTLHGRREIGGEVTSLTVFVGAGEARFFDASMVFTSAVPKAFTLLQTAPRATASLAPPNPSTPAPAAPTAGSKKGKHR